MSDKELDRAVAEKVMGWDYGYQWVGDDDGNGEDQPAWFGQDGRLAVAEVAWHPSTDLADAWRVVEHMRKRKWLFYCEWDYEREVLVEFESVTDFTCWIRADTLPRAICEAALKAMEGDA